MATTDYREKCLAEKVNECHACHETGKLLVHHIDGDPENNKLENLVPLCRSCHSKVHSTKHPAGFIKELQDQLPKKALTYTDEPADQSQRSGSRATKRIPVTPSTKRLLDEEKDDKKPYDLWIREQIGVD